MAKKKRKKKEEKKFSERGNKQQRRELRLLCIIFLQACFFRLFVSSFCFCLLSVFVIFFYLLMGEKLSSS